MIDGYSGSVPFTRVQECSCDTLGCACSVAFSDFLPEWADIKWARLSVEVLVLIHVYSTVQMYDHMGCMKVQHTCDFPPCR
jgi:hypothetical protein